MCVLLTTNLPEQTNDPLDSPYFTEYTDKLHRPCDTSIDSSLSSSCHLIKHTYILLTPHTTHKHYVDVGAALLFHASLSIVLDTPSSAPVLESLGVGRSAIPARSISSKPNSFCVAVVLCCRIRKMNIILGVAVPWLDSAVNHGISLDQYGE